MPELSEVLGRLGLGHYRLTFMTHGFEDWETVLDITEDDLANMGVKLGHRRILQREIARFRGIPSSESLEPYILDNSTPIMPIEELSAHRLSPAPKEKRRYRRHPRPDCNAPKKPRTAYVNFADNLRSDPEIKSLSFVDIAKEVGRRWQTLPAEQKRVWESEAARALQEYEVAMDEYKQTDAWRNYQAYLSEFKAQQAQAQATKHRRPGTSRIDSFLNTESSRLSQASSENRIALAPSSSTGTETGTETEQCHNALTLAFSELVALRGEILLAQGVRPYGEHHLPPEELTRRAMHAFVLGTGSLIYSWTISEVDEILERVYRPTTRADPMSLAECFTVAAMGAHYDADCFPDHKRHLLYASGTLYFHEETACVDYMRTMRLLLSLSFYAILEKHMSARYLVAAGLQIARWKCPPLSQSIYDETPRLWRRIFKSLVFMDSWLSYTLGYPSEVKSTDVLMACAPIEFGTAPLDEVVQTQISSVSLIAAEISHTLAAPKVITRAEITRLSQKLEAWRAQVPPPLQFGALTSGQQNNFSLFEKRAILMVHIMYLGALILLYRQVLVTATKAQLDGELTADVEVSVEDFKRYRDECGVAAQQIARILSLFSFNETLTKRCWLLIYWSFTACVVLLFTATTKLLDGQSDSVDADLAYAQSCMAILEACKDSEPVARGYLEITAPLRESLREIRRRMVQRARTSIHMLLQGPPGQPPSPPIPVSKQEVRPGLETLCGLLMDPFGRRVAVLGGSGGRRVQNPDGSFSVFWWK